MYEKLCNQPRQRLCEIIGDKKRGIPPIIPISRSKWLKGVKEGIFPQPVRIGIRIIAWKSSDILALLKKIECGESIKIEQSQRMGD